MRGFGDIRNWLRVPGRLGLLLGLGALSVTGARADMPAPMRSIPSPASDGLSIRSEGGRIYISEGGRDFQEIRLADTQEARHLTQLLARRGAGPDGAGVVLPPIILAGAGGSGFDWTAAPKATEPLSLLP